MEPNSSEIRAQLAKVLAADIFRASPTSSRLLEYLVEEYLAGRSDRLKGYSIGVDVFGRNADFDAASDSIVRVQMGRLRKLLDDYYVSDDGRSDRLRFLFPKGSYVPVIADPQSDGRRSFLLRNFGGGRPFGKTAMLSVLALLLIAAVAIIGGAWWSQRAQPLPERNEPRVFVAQFKPIDGREETRLIAQGLQHDLIALLSRYPNLEILGFETVAGEGGGRPITDWHNADYLLSGSVASVGDSIRVSSELVSVRKGTVLWSSVENVGYANVSDILQSQSEIALKVGATLGQPDGVIQQASKSLIAESNGVSFTNYACVLAAYDYKRKKEATKHLKIRNCLEKVTQDNPDYSIAWSMLSWVLGDEHRHGFNPQRKGSAALKSLQAAEKGVASSPFSATAHQYLSTAQFYLGQDQKARQSMAIARRLNPDGPEILADSGWQDAHAGSSDDARAYFEAALKLNPNPPSWYWGGLAIDAIRNGDAERAGRFAALYDGDGLLSLYVKAAALRLAGNDAAADRTLDMAARLYPKVAQDEFLQRNRLDARFKSWLVSQ